MHVLSTHQVMVAVLQAVSGGWLAADYIAPTSMAMQAALRPLGGRFTELNLQ